MKPASTYKIHSKTQSWYGQEIGILILDAAYPCIPGNVGNATSFDFPVQYMEVQGASIDRLLVQADAQLAAPFVAAAQELERRGVRAITGACGFMALFQREVAAAVRVPVLLSSLLQIPLLYAISSRPVGVITARAASLSPRHFAACGIDPAIPLEIADMAGCEEFSGAILQEKGSLDSDAIEREVLAVAGELLARCPEVGTILLECSDLPPYAYAIEQKFGLPVFDYTTLINLMHGGLRPRRYA